MGVKALGWEYYNMPSTVLHTRSNSLQVGSVRTRWRQARVLWRRLADQTGQFQTSALGFKSEIEGCRWKATTVKVTEREKDEAG